jgi:PPM family protein phosphatase
LMGCLGTEDDPPMDFPYIPNLRPGDVLMCCSDGVWHYFSPAELGSVLSALTPRESTEFLIDKARTRARGTGDNLSIVVVKLDPLAEKPGEAARKVEIPSIHAIKAGKV